MTAQLRFTVPAAALGYASLDDPAVWAETGRKDPRVREIRRGRGASVVIECDRATAEWITSQLDFTLSAGFDADWPGGRAAARAALRTIRAALAESSQVPGSDAVT